MSSAGALDIILAKLDQVQQSQKDVEARLSRVEKALVENALVSAKSKSDIPAKLDTRSQVWRPLRPIDSKQPARLGSLRPHAISVTHTAPGPAQIEVIGTTELLELILLLVKDYDGWLEEEEDHVFNGYQTILFSRRVSKHFRAVVDGSILIQRALFFEPDQTRVCTTTHPHLKNLTKLITATPVILEESNTDGTATLKSLPNGAKSAANVKHASIQYDGLEGGKTLHLGLDPYSMSDYCTAKAEGRPHSRCPDCKRNHFGDPSWKRLFLTQPPVDIKLTMGSPLMSIISRPKTTWHIKGGCRIGELFDKISQP